MKPRTILVSLFSLFLLNALAGAQNGPQMQRKALPQLPERPAVSRLSVQPDLESGTGNRTVNRTARPDKNDRKDDVAYVTLQVVSDNWPGENGYQVLLDKDCNTADYFYENKFQFQENDVNYADYFEYAVPEEALEDIWASVAQGGERTIEIEPGFYDMVIVFAENSEHYRMFWVQGVMNRFNFCAGCRYKITVTGNVPSFTQSIPYDLGVNRIVSHGPTGSGLTAQETLSVNVYNDGITDAGKYSLTCTVDDAEPFTEHITTPLPAGASVVYTFEHKVDFSAKGEHKIKIEVATEDEGEHDYVALNNVLETSVWHVDPVATPFSCGFDTSLNLDWMVDDANGDGRSWFIYIDDVSDVTVNRCARIHTYQHVSPGRPEALITRYPIHLKPGMNHIVFKDRGVQNFPENYDVLIGKKPVSGEMEKLGSFNLTSSTRRMVLHCINFTTEEEGDYYFAFNAYGDPDLSFLLDIDDVVIDTGEFITPPDLQVEKFLAPVSACGLGENETLKIRISNQGYADVTKVGVRGTLNGEPFEKVVNATIAILSTRDITFSGLDLSAEGTEYKLDYEVFVPEDGCRIAESVLDNNGGEAVIKHWTPMDVPFVCNFVNENDTSWNNWICADPTPWRRTYGMNITSSEPVVSRCMNLKAGASYRLHFRFLAGGASLIQNIYDDLKIVYGKTGSRISGWTALFNERNLYTYDMFLEKEVEFTVNEDGVYNLAMISETGRGTVFIKELSLYEIIDYDLELASFGPLPVMLPEDHANGKYVLPVVLANRGKKAVASAKVTIKLNGETVGEESFFMGNAGNVMRKEIAVETNGIKVGEELEFTASAVIEGHEADDTNPNNVLGGRVTVSGEVLAYDVATEELCYDDKNWIGSNNNLPLACAMAMYFGKVDTLTAVSILLGEGEEYATTVDIYEFNPAAEQLGRKIYTAEERITGQAGNCVLEVPSLMLNPGWYMVSIVIDGYILVVDDNLDGTFYVISEGWAYPQTGLGLPAIRAVFGHDGQPAEIDAEVLDIPKPLASGPFSANQKVLALVRNMGSKDVPATVTLSVDDEQVAEKPVTLKAYETRELEFTANLSVVGKHDITVAVECEGDENLLNNALTKTVETMAPANPYYMDFEECNDWDIEDFNPLWTSVDGDGAMTGGFPDLNFPHMLEPYGFIVFNPSLLEFGEGAALEIAPYNGERLGVAMYNLRREKNDDWLISPPLLLPENNAWMSLRVKTYIDYRGLETYQVLVSETGNLNDFTVLHEAEAPDKAWEYVGVNLSEYAGKTVYVAVRCISENKFIFMVDDIRVSEPGNANEASLAASLQLYPNPVRKNLTIRSSNGDIEEVSIIGVSGVEVFRSRASFGEFFRYDVSGLTPGLYFARVRTSQGTAVLKFLK